MRFIDTLVGRKSKVTGEMTVGITETGKSEAQKFSSRGANFAILSALDEKSPQSVRDISLETGIDVSDVKARVARLARQGYVRFTGLEV